MLWLKRFYYSPKDVTAMLHIINAKEIVNQTVLAVVGCSFFTFFIISTRFRQNIIAKIGIK
ncbi:MAG TPA: hypothetical protein DEB37_04520 [Lysinibacillus sp.]|uniref:Uncharacterized protein n=1 Tax=Lysinibacillus fusiformis TaxID=28031 RepID=A0A2I0UXX8_9BACI|nr:MULTISPECIES: hypothetical protein [Lysinibacillus]PKU50915.1 hypothetical protein CRI88_14625 [Lysinibacillus fusiformis]HBT71545.1 hypothetical protein [Lysinibacillus sp.]